MTNAAITKHRRRTARQPRSDASETHGAKAANTSRPAIQERSDARKPNKTDTVLALLKREGGATLDQLVAATGWLPHSARAALTGLKKKGHLVERNKVDGVNRYATVKPASQ